jgi:hypothetical protein
MIFIRGKSVDIGHLWLMKSYNNIFTWVWILILVPQGPAIIYHRFCIIFYNILLDLRLLK